MIIYNVTVTLNENIHSRWVEWIRKEHIPEVLSTRLFKKAVQGLLKYLKRSAGQGTNLKQAKVTLQP